MIIVVGGGILGLATALRILEMRPNSRLLLIEKEPELAQHQTGHNSGVIHSGLYYKPGTFKAINCRNGYMRLLNFCRAENIPHDICGKIVVASNDAELPGLDELYRRGLANGLEGLKYLNPEEIQEIEPHCHGRRGLFVPQTGIVDYAEVARKYAEKLTQMGAEIVLGEVVLDVLQSNNHVEVVGESKTWVARAVVICAGLHSDRLARKTLPDLPLRILPFRGEYYKLKPSAEYMVRHMIYPVPDSNLPFLGVHFTRMVGGGVECGPNAVFAFGREAYRKSDFNALDVWESFSWPGFHKLVRRHWRSGLDEYHRSLSKPAFVKALQKLIPEIRTEDIEPADAGVRAQACDLNGNLLDDFDVRMDKNVIHVCNAPSPAATASLSIGNAIAEKVISLLS